jgi:uncharacterized protein (DUF1015 family)
MAIVKPFKAIRATRDKVAMVSSKSYEIYTQEMLDAKLAFNPYTFLHVINPGYKYQKQDISGELRFKLVHNRYLEFKENENFTQDKIPAFYIYQKTTPTKSFCGIISATSVADYHNKIIKKHEGTLKQRELLFDTIIKKYKQQRAEYEFSTTDKDSHVLWVVNDAHDIDKITSAFKEIDTLYIADGHHRSTSSCLLAERLAKENPHHTGNEDYNFFMSYLLPESELSIYEFNRFIKDLNGLTPNEFLIELDTFFRIENRKQELYKPKDKHHFSMYLDGEFYALYLRKTLYNFSDALSKLDAQILYTTVLKPILGIEDIRNDSKIVYSQNKSDSLELKNKVDSGDFKVSFGMLPTTIKELKEIVDADLLMPPKTTYIEPKLRSALTIYEF